MYDSTYESQKWVKLNFGVRSQDGTENKRVVEWVDTQRVRLGCF